MNHHLPLIIGAAAVLLLLAFLWRAIRSARSRDHRAWNMRWRIRLRLRPGEGWASKTELSVRWSKFAAWSDHGRRARPSMGRWQLLTHRTTDGAVRLGRSTWFKRVYVRMQDQVMIISPQQMGKSAMLADRIIDHPGPVIATSTQDNLYRDTAGERSHRGRVWVFNPLRIGGIPSTFGWDIIAGCENPGTAIRRAQDLTGDYPTGDMKWWQSKASASLAAFLHAAALAPWATITDVYEWVARMGDVRAVQILDSADNASQPLRAVLEEIRGSGKTADSTRATISECLTWIAIPELAAAASPPPGEGFEVSDFLDLCGTLYMIAPGDETAPVAPLFQAFLQHVHYEAGLIASRRASGKLDPPMLYSLDELTQVCPVPLPKMLADAANRGILISPVVHSYGQLEERYGRSGAETIWATCATKILFGGITDPVTLEHITRICGTVGLKDGKDGPAVPPDLLRVMPKWRATVISGTLRPVAVKTRPVFHRWNRRFGRAPVAPPILLSTIPAPRLPMLSDEAKRYTITDPPTWPAGTPVIPAAKSNGASTDHAG